MATDNITEIGIDNLERLYIIPQKEQLTMIWRSATEVHWDTNMKCLYSPKPREWTYYQWYCHIIEVVKDECDCQLFLTTKTTWNNIPDQLRNEICNKLDTHVIITTKRMITRGSIFYCLRWVFLLPLSIGIGLLASSIIEFILSYFVSASSLKHYNYFSSRLIISFLSVTLAHWIAPKYKSTTTIVICSIWLLLVLLGLIITSTDIKLYGEEYKVNDGGLAIAMTILGVALGYYLLWKRRMISAHKKV